MTDLKTRLLTSLDNLGFTERTKADQSQDKLDPLAHEFVVTAIMRPYAEKRYKKAKEKLLASLNPATLEKLDSVVKGVAKTGSAGAVMLADTQHHSVTANVNPGASYLDEGMLKLALTKWMEPPEIEVLFEKHRKRYNPTVTYIVSEK